MGKQYTVDELKKMESGDLSRIVLMQQEQLSRLAGDYEKLLEQLRIASQARFGRRSEKLDVIDGQMSLFDEAEAAADAAAEEPSAEEVVSSYRRKNRRVNARRT